MLPQENFVKLDAQRSLLRSFLGLNSHMFCNSWQTELLLWLYSLEYIVSNQIHRDPISWFLYNIIPYRATVQSAACLGGLLVLAVWTSTKSRVRAIATCINQELTHVKSHFLMCRDPDTTYKYIASLFHIIIFIYISITVYYSARHI